MSSVTRNSALEAVFLAVALLLLFITGVFSALAANNIKKNSNYDRDPTLNKARNYLIWAAIISFIGFVLMLIMLVLFFVYRDKAASWKTVSLIMSIITLVLAFVVGILAALGANGIRKSQYFTGTGSDSTSYTQAIIAAVVSLAGIGILLIVYIIFKAFIQTKTGEKYVPEIPGRTSTRPAALNQPLPRPPKTLDQLTPPPKLPVIQN